jgi:hypothetical protein
VTAGTFSGGGQTPKYRRRRPLPALIMLVLLGIGALIVWLRVIDTNVEQAAAVRCDPPATATVEPGQPAPPPAPPLGQHVEQNGLDQTPAIPLSQVNVRVLNASTQRGQAALVTESLRQIGFSQVAKPGDDPVYPESDMTCRGQIRFGPQGASAARTLSLLEPCAELIQDNRADGTVDLVVGRKFDEVQPKSETRQLFKQIADWEAQNPAQSGGLQSVQAGPPLDQALITSLRGIPCG